MSNVDEAVLRIYTAKSQADKAINSLKGILQGINLDAVVNDREIEELLKWAKTHNQLIGRNPFNEFMSLIEATVSEGLPLSETIEDLYWLCQKYEGDNYYYNAVTTDLQTLQGLCHGILADGEVSDAEIHGLNAWLEANEHLNTYYPYDEIRSLILSIVSDNKVDDDERIVLKAYFNQFVKLNNQEMLQRIASEVANIHISGLCSSDPKVVFQGKTFCVTGILKRGSRESLENDIRKLGGIPTNSITQKTDYLIVGDNGNPAWAFSCYGRKVEKAISMRKMGHTITLIHEFDFSDLVDDLI